MTALVVAVAVVAGALGALARYGVTRWVSARFGAARLTRAVLIVNVAGSLIGGALIGATTGAAHEVQYILAGGFAGGLTTFSTWTVETVQLVLDGKMAAATRNVILNLAAGLLAAVAGALATSGILAVV